MFYSNNTIELPMQSPKNTLKWLRCRYNVLLEWMDPSCLYKCYLLLPWLSWPNMSLFGCSDPLVELTNPSLCSSSVHDTWSRSTASYVTCPCRMHGMPWNTSYEDHNFHMDNNMRRKWNSMVVLSQTELSITSLVVLS